MIKYIKFTTMPKKALPSINIKYGESEIFVDNKNNYKIENLKISIAVEKLILETYCNNSQYNYFYSNTIDEKDISILKSFFGKIIITPCACKKVRFYEIVALNPKVSAINLLVKRLLEEEKCEYLLYHFLIEKNYLDFNEDSQTESFYEIKTYDEEKKAMSALEKTIEYQLQLIPIFTLNILGYTFDDILADTEFQQLCAHFPLLYLWYHNEKFCQLRIVRV